MDNKEKIITLTKELNEYAKDYYEKDAPTISDELYDQLYLELVNLEKKYPEYKQIDSPTNKVASGKISQKFTKVKHSSLMGSLKNAFTLDDLQKFYDEVNINYPEATIIAENKVDGLALVLRYENGLLVQAITRGNGEVGEDVTENIRQVSIIPKKLNKLISIEIRGEIYLDYPTFQTLNEKRKLLGLKLFANPRNAAAGTIRQLNTNIVKERNLQFVPYGVIEKDYEQLFATTKQTQNNVYTQLAHLGFTNLPTPIECKTVNDANKLIHKIGKEKNNLQIPIDGIVFKVNEFKYQLELDYTGKYPNFAIAYKFPAEKVISQILSVDLQVGRTGNVTPVANITPVEIAETIVSRATLHNFAHIKTKDFKVNDYVYVQKAGEIIPEIVEVIIEKRSGEEQEIIVPTNCPVCNTKLSLSQSQITLQCLNSNCPSKIINRIIHFCSRDAMNIVGLGSKVLQKMYESQIIQTYADIYKLSIEQLLTLDKIKQKSAINIVEAINNSKNVNLATFIYSLGIPGVGLVNSKSLAKRYPNIEQLFLAKAETLQAIEDIGPILAKNITDYMSNEEHQEEIKQLIALGITFEKQEIDQTSAYYGKNIVITGTFKYSRQEIKLQFEKLGANVKNSISKKTDFVIIGESAGSKADKAVEYNLNVIDETILEKIMEEKHENNN